MWSPAGTLKHARNAHTCTPLANGTALVVGGHSFSQMKCVAVAELWSAPSTFRSAGQLTIPRMFHQSVRLNDGAVAVVGGCDDDGNALAHVELWDPVKGTFSAIAPMRMARQLHTALLLHTGEILVAGGLTRSGVTTSCESYDPREDRWREIAPLRHARASHAALALQDRRVLVFGGFSDPEALSVLASVEAWNGRTFDLAPTATLLHRDPQMIELPDASVVVMGSRSARAERWHPAAHEWFPVPPLPHSISGFTLTRCGEHGILVGGFRESDEATAAEEPAQVEGATWELSQEMKWNAAPALIQPRHAHTTTRLQGGGLLVVGGLSTESDDEGSAELLAR